MPRPGETTVTRPPEMGWRENVPAGAANVVPGLRADTPLILKGWQPLWSPIITLEFFVAGIPQPQGSKSFKGVTKTGKAILLESVDGLYAWREAIGWKGLEAMRGLGQPPGLPGEALRGRPDHALTGPICARLEFILKRPVRTPKSRNPPAVKKPDLDKLVRAVLDALTKVVFVDDSQVIELHANKRLAAVGETPGVHIRIETLP